MRSIGSYTFNAPPDEIWKLLLDPQVLLQVVPGLQTVDVVSPTEYVASAQVGVGPVKGVFSGTVKIVEQTPPTYAKLTGEGKGGPGFVRGDCVLRFAPQGAATLVNYEANIQIGGTLASVGQRLIDATQTMMLNQTFAAFARVLEARATGVLVEDALPMQLMPAWMDWGIAALISLIVLTVFFGS